MGLGGASPVAGASRTARFDIGLSSRMRERGRAGTGAGATTGRDSRPGGRLGLLRSQAGGAREPPPVGVVPWACTTGTGTVAERTAGSGFAERPDAMKGAS